MTVVRALRRLGNLLLWVTAALGVASLLAAAVMIVSGVRPMIIRSGSMSPTITTGSVTLTRKVDASSVRAGQIVSVVDARGARVTHRVVSVNPHGRQASLVLRGDANRQDDQQPYVVSSAYRVFAHVPWLGYALAWAGGSWGVFAGGVIATAVVASVWPRRSAGRRVGRRSAGASVG